MQGGNHKKVTMLTIVDEKNTSSLTFFLILVSNSGGHGVTVD